MLSAYRTRLTGGSRKTLEHAAELGLLGSSDLDTEIDHALGFAAAFERSLGRPPRSVLDLGSGGGLPGLVLHEVWPETEVVLLDSNRRRTEFLRSELSAPGGGEPQKQAPVEVLRGRAEEVAHDPLYRERFEAVSSRSFGRPAVVAECGAPFLRTRGVLVVSEPPDGDGLARWPATGLAEVGLGPGEALRIEGRFNYRLLEKQAPSPERFPRRVGVPAKRPLF